LNTAITTGTKTKARKASSQGEEDNFLTLKSSELRKLFSSRTSQFATAAESYLFFLVVLCSAHWGDHRRGWIT